MTKPTKSFFILSSFVAMLAVVALTAQQVQRSKLQPLKSGASGLEEVVRQNSQAEQFKLYEDNDHGITFEYPESWAVETGNENGMFYIRLLPTEVRPPIAIYIGSDYYGFANLETVPVEVNGYRGVRVDDSLLGLANENRHYTFDLSNNQEFKKEFLDLLSTIQLY